MIQRSEKLGLDSSRGIYKFTQALKSGLGLPDFYTVRQQPSKPGCIPHSGIRILQTDCAENVRSFRGTALCEWAFWLGQAVLMIGIFLSLCPLFISFQSVMFCFVELYDVFKKRLAELNRS